LKPTLQTALSLRSAGVSCIPVNADKRPTISSWKKFVDTLPTEDQQSGWFANGAAIAVIAGDIQCIDVDEKYRPGLMAQFEQAARSAGLAAIWDRVLIQQTPSGGYHLVFRCQGDPIRNMKLAQKGAEENHETLIETRGKGGYFLIAPSAGYEVQQGDFEMLPILTEEERADLIDIARSFNERAPRDQPAKPSGPDLSPGDDYDQRADVDSLLTKHGWTKVGDKHWRRPGKDRGVSASFDVIPSRFWVWSTSTPFETEHLYRPYAVYAVLEHDGDYSAACKDLKRQGYGTAQEGQKSGLKEALSGGTAVDPRKSLERAQEAKSKEQQEAEELSLIEKLAKVEFWPGPEPEDEICLFELSGIEIAHVGNHITLIAPIKSGKSAFVGAILAATCGAGSESDLLGLSPTNRSGKAVIHIDTEQSRNDHHRLLTRSLRRCAVDRVPDYLLSFCMTGWEPKEIQQSIEFLAERASEAFGGIHSIIIDGIADLISSPNDEEESNTLERWFRTLSIKHHCCGIGVIHQNPGSEKSRGHLGSQFERKSETVLILEKKEEKTMVYSTRTRRAPIIKGEGPCFEWSDEAMAHVSCDSPLIEPSKTKSAKPSMNKRIDMAISYVKELLTNDAYEMHELHSIIESKFDIGLNNRKMIITQAAEAIHGTDKRRPKAGRAAPWVVGPAEKVARKCLELEQNFESEKQGEL